MDTQRFSVLDVCSKSWALHEEEELCLFLDYGERLRIFWYFVIWLNRIGFSGFGHGIGCILQGLDVNDHFTDDDSKKRLSYDDFNMEFEIHLVQSQNKEYVRNPSNFKSWILP